MVVASETRGDEPLCRVCERGGAWCHSGGSRDTVVVGVPLGNPGGRRGDLKSRVGVEFELVISEVEAQPSWRGLCEGVLVHPRTSCVSLPWRELTHG